MEINQRDTSGLSKRGLQQQAEPLAVNVTEACRLLSIGRTSLYELLKTGDLRSRKVGNRTLVTMASIREFVGEGV